MPCSHGHRTCRDIDRAITEKRAKQGKGPRTSFGVGVMILSEIKHTDSKGRPIVIPVALLGLERGGAFRGMFNISAGSMEHKDRGCFLGTARRELEQEFKILFSSWDAFDAFFKTNGRYEWILSGETPVFIARQNLRRGPLNKAIATANADWKLPPEEREMERVEWVSLDTNPRIIYSSRPGRPFQTPRPVIVSSFFTSIVKKLRRQGGLPP